MLMTYIFIAKFQLVPNLVKCGPRNANASTFSKTLYADNTKKRSFKAGGW